MNKGTWLLPKGSDPAKDRKKREAKVASVDAKKRSTFKDPPKKTEAQAAGQQNPGAESKDKEGTN